MQWEASSLCLYVWLGVPAAYDRLGQRQREQSACFRSDGCGRNPETGGWAIDSLTCLQVSRLWKLFLKACEFETFPVRCSLVVKIVCCEVLYLVVSELEFEKSCEK